MIPSLEETVLSSVPAPLSSVKDYGTFFCLFVHTLNFQCERLDEPFFFVHTLNFQRERLNSSNFCACAHYEIYEIL